MKIEEPVGNEDVIQELMWIALNLPIEFRMKEECPVDILMCAMGRLRMYEQLIKEHNAKV